MIVVSYGLLIVNTHGRGMWVKHMYINGEDFNKPLEGRGMWVKHMYINGEDFNKPLELRKPESLGGQPYC